MGWFDIVLRVPCHDISGDDAMQHTQFNFSRKIPPILLAIAGFWAAGPAFGGSITGPSRPDPLLDGGPADPCTQQADLAPGRDVNGRPVAPADVGAAKVPVPDQIAIPVGGTHQPGRRNAGSVSGAANGTYVSLDGKTLAPLLNPPACARH
jgi:hypothetical protein